MRRLVSPTANRITYREIFSSFAESIFSRDLLNRFEKKAADFIGVEHVYFVNYGRNALCLILKALKKIVPQKDEVIVPGYICPTVAQSVYRAGLKLILCDLSKDDLDLDRDHLEGIISEDTLAVVANHPFGYTSDIDKIKNITQRHGSFLIEDGAQALGSVVAGRKAGAMADAGFFSLGPGKNVTIGNGGIIATNSDQLACVIEEFLVDVLEPDLFHDSVIFIKLLVYALLIRPELFLLVEPLLNNSSAFRPSTVFTDRRINNFQAALGLRLFERLDDDIERKSQKVECLRKGLYGVNGVKLFNSTQKARPSYLRFPILLRSARERDAIFDALRNEGIRSGKMYGRSLNRFEEFGVKENTRLTNSEYIADRLLTLPIHSFVSKDDLKTIMRIIRANV